MGKKRCKGIKIHLTGCAPSPLSPCDRKATQGSYCDTHVKQAEKWDMLRAVLVPGWAPMLRRMVKEKGRDAILAEAPQPKVESLIESDTSSPPKRNYFDDAWLDS